VKLISAISAVAFVAGIGMAPVAAQTTDQSQSQPSAAQSEKSGSTGATGLPSQSSSSTGSSSSVGTTDKAPPASASSATTSAPKSWYSNLKADALIGKKVVDKDGRKVGEIDDLVRDSKDQKIAAVIGVGGFLGIGEKKVAVPLADLQRATNADDAFVIGRTEDELKAMPKYADDQYQRLDRNASLAAIN
jgi:sporulation protein YlmC with PRC-barrel domain